MEVLVSDGDIVVQHGDGSMQPRHEGLTRRFEALECTCRPRHCSGTIVIPLKPRLKGTDLASPGQRTHPSQRRRRTYSVREIGQAPALDLLSASAMLHSNVDAPQRKLALVLHCNTSSNTITTPAC